MVNTMGITKNAIAMLKVIFFNDTAGFLLETD